MFPGQIEIGNETSQQHFLFNLFLSSTEEEYKRLSEALADEGTYNAVAFKYSADYYDPSQPTEEEDAKKEPGRNWSDDTRHLNVSYNSGVGYTTLL